MERSMCDMRGFLSFLILWMLKRKAMSGAELAKELETRRGAKPNPGTIYPALKELVVVRAITVKATEGKEKIYVLTPTGRQQLVVARQAFCKTFYDIFTR